MGNLFLVVAVVLQACSRIERKGESQNRKHAKVLTYTNLFFRSLFFFDSIISVFNLAGWFSSFDVVFLEAHLYHLSFIRSL